MNCLYLCLFGHSIGKRHRNDQYLYHHIFFIDTFRGRLRHGRHFTYKSVLNDVAITLVSSSVVGSIADEHHPYAAHGPWLQVISTFKEFETKRYYVKLTYIANKYM